MTKNSLYRLTVFSLLLAPLTIGAQSASVLSAGARVRLTTPKLDADQRTGRVVSAEADTIQFRSDVYPVTRTFAMSDITMMELSAGRVSNKGRFALIGLLAGGAIGFAAGYHESGGHGGQMIGGGKKSPSENAFLSAGIGGALGSLGGWLVGRSRVSERWVRVRAEDR
jgi:hypothetical protein